MRDHFRRKQVTKICPALHKTPQPFHSTLPPPSQEHRNARWSRSANQNQALLSFYLKCCTTPRCTPFRPLLAANTLCERRQGTLWIFIEVLPDWPANEECATWLADVCWLCYLIGRRMPSGSPSCFWREKKSVSKLLSFSKLLSTLTLTLTQI